MGTITRTHTRTHVSVAFADPYLRCDRCGAWVPEWHDPDRCGPGCEAGWFLMPCEHRAASTSACPGWSPVNGCTCPPEAHARPPAAIVGDRLA